MLKQIAVIGLGRFGENLCRELTEQGAEVLAIDINSKAVNHIATFVEHAVIADITDNHVIEELGLANYQSVIVSLGTDVGSSILATISLKEAGVSNLWVKSNSALHTKTLKKVGADHVINPERLVAKRVCKQLISPQVQDVIDLDGNLVIYQLNIADTLINKSISDLKLPNEIRVLSLIRASELLDVSDIHRPLHLHDILLLAGTHTQLSSTMHKL